MLAALYRHEKSYDVYFLFGDPEEVRMFVAALQRLLTHTVPLISYCQRAPISLTRIHFLVQPLGPRVTSSIGPYGGGGISKQRKV